MKILELLQGTEEWKAARAQRNTASEAAAVFGHHKYMTRDQLLRQKAFGLEEEISRAQQDIFNRGHDAEAGARPIAETIVGEELYPCTVEDDTGKYLASMDGLDMLGEIGFEHKLANDTLLAQVEAGELEEHYKWQMDHQMMVSGAMKILFMVSDGTENRMAHMWYERDEYRIKQLLMGWEQFEADLRDYQPEVIPAKPEADAIEAFPALSVALVGEVKSSNLPVFKSRAMAYIDSINTKLETDEDFANAEAAVKFCEHAEKEIDLVKSQALAQTNTIDELFRTMDSIRESLRQKRLMLDKLVKQRKESLKTEIINEARQKLMNDIATANEEFRPVVVNGVTADFANAAKNKRTFASLRSAVNDELTRARLQLSERRDHVRASIKIIKDAGDDYRFLFNDIQQLVDKSHDFLQMIVKQRVDEHKAEQERKIKEEAERRAKEIAAENERKALAAQQEEARRLAAEQVQPAQKAEPAPAAEPAAQPAPAATTTIQQKPRVVSSGGSAIPTRPTDDQIIAVLALHYRVHESKVIEWLCAMNLDTASDRTAAAL